MFAYVIPSSQRIRLTDPFRRWNIYYSVMQSGNSFCWDVVLDIFNKAFWDEDNIWNKILKSKCVWIIILKILFCITLYENAH